MELDTALIVLRKEMEPVSSGTWDEFIERLSVPIRVAELVSDRAREAVGVGLLWGYKTFHMNRGESVQGFCREVRDGLINIGVSDPPSIETLRGWYYAASKPELLHIAQEDGFGMASACLLANDPEGERAAALYAAAKQVASETGMGQVSAARQLRAAYRGQDEQEWADGLPVIVYWEHIDGELILGAQWRDDRITQIGTMVNPEKAPLGTPERVAGQYVLNLLHARKR